jgi:hypothetical protein
MMADDESAVIINVRTEMVTTLALASVAAFDLPVIVINCDPTGFSREYFSLLRRQFPFTLMEAPIRTHGATLDWLFSVLTADRVLLLDSDAEIRNAVVVDDMRRRMREGDHVFGAGWLNYGHWLDERVGATKGIA